MCTLKRNGVRVTRSFPIAMRAVDLFCGCGGFSQGLADAGVAVALGVDVDAVALRVHAANHRGARSVKHDITDVEGTASLVRDVGGVDLLVGSTPCQDFSSAGKKVETGAVAGLTAAFGRLVALCRPACFVLENVPTMINSGAFRELDAEVASAGYAYIVVTMDAKYAGTCQSRRRIFVCGSRLQGAPEALSRVQKAMVRAQREGKSGAPVTVRDVLGERCGESVYFPARNRFHPCVLSTRQPYPTLRAHRGKCLERPPTTYTPRYDDVAAMADAHVLDVRDASLIASFPPGYDWSVCARAEAGRMIGNCVPPAMVAQLLRVMHNEGVLPSTPDAAPAGGAPAVVGEVAVVRRQRGQIPSHIDMFDACGGVGADVRADSTGRKCLRYVFGSCGAGDAAMRRILSFEPRVGWVVVFRERMLQRHRVDDLYIQVPGRATPYRGQTQLRKHGLLA